MDASTATTAPPPWGEASQAAQAIEIAIDRDRWRRLATELESRRPDRDRCPWLWRIWRDRADKATAALAAAGEAIALAERAIRATDAGAVGAAAWRADAMSAIRSARDAMDIGGGPDVQ